MLLIQKLGRALVNIGGVLMATLLVWAGPVMAEDNLTAKAVSGVEVDEQSTPCKGLKPFNNLDELLYQFYINLDSDCLFEMPVAKLEEIWGIKILDDRLTTSEQKYDQIKNNIDFYNKPYKSEGDAFYVAVFSDLGSGGKMPAFGILITKEYYEEHATLYPNGNLPTLLPSPQKRYRNEKIYSLGDGLRPENIGNYNLLTYTYYWSSLNDKHHIKLTGTAGVIAIMIY